MVLFIKSVDCNFVQGTAEETQAHIKWRSEKEALFTGRKNSTRFDFASL